MDNEAEKKTLVPSVSFLMDPRYFLALGFGSGLSRWAPGTCGTIAAIPFYWFFLAEIEILEYFFLMLVAIVVGVYVCKALSIKLRSADHPSIVWDEFVGLWISLCGIPKEIGWLIAATIVFRFLDIFKPWPIKVVDSNIKGGIGIMLDDVLAGLLTCIFLNTASMFLLWRH